MNLTLRLVLAACLAFATAPATFAQTVQRPTYTPPPGVEFEIVLYPITRFRGNGRSFKRSDERINVPMNIESLYLVRGIWEICSEQFYYGRCIVVTGSQQGIVPPFPVRSVRLIGDSGPTFVDSPVARAGPDVPMALTRPSEDSELARAAPEPVVAPAAAEGGLAGANPSLAGRAVEFFPAPAANGFRVLACAASPGTNPPARCIQATADGFCAAEGFRDSGWREIETVGNRTYLVNVLCKQVADSDAARDSSGIRIPFF